MGNCVCCGALLQCSFGVAPSPLMVIPQNMVLCGAMPAATVMDFTPTNIITFGLCQSMLNPTVAAATAAAMGVLTPMPCQPLVIAPWTPGSTKTMIGNMPALTDNSKTTCAFGGTISINFAGQATVQVS
ncbi:MAG: DUF4280 domain-containing protein [Oscillospiraceae bacterium]|nr:DUF4280 domain-containing protein [Oscillospiraceae bacterium]